MAYNKLGIRNSNGLEAVVAHSGHNIRIVDSKEKRHEERELEYPEKDGVHGQTKKDTKGQIWRVKQRVMENETESDMDSETESDMESETESDMESETESDMESETESDGE
eukprot:Nk52_evm25s208 gene=Nk52_evmTU25s208